MMLRKGAMVCMVVLLLSMASGEAIWSQESPGMASDGEIPSFHRGSGTEDDPYMIYDVHDLQAMRDDLEAHYALAKDIDASETREWNQLPEPVVWVSGTQYYPGDFVTHQGTNYFCRVENSDEDFDDWKWVETTMSEGDPIGFEPIGTDDNRFTGGFDGRNYTIYGLYINRGTDYVGFFGAINTWAVVENVGLVGNDVSGNDRVGGLVGLNDGTVENSYATGNVSGNWLVGGLVGYSTGTVSNSYSTGAVNGNWYVGGLLGYQIHGGLVENSFAMGKVSGGDRVGGLVGESYQSTISSSYAGGDTIGVQSNIGGLLGLNTFSTVSNSYASGTVSGASSVGGLMGGNWYGTVSNSYATGTVSGHRNVGGLVGSNHGTVSNSFYNVDSVLINDGHHITIGGLFNEQYEDWFHNGLHLNIADYSDTLVPFDDHYEISTVDGLRDLLGFAGQEYHEFRLVTDIDLYDASGLYIPILKGHFYGGGNVIYNLHVDAPFASNIGMFGDVNDGKVTNISLINAFVKGYEYVGMIAGSGSVYHSHAVGNVSGGNITGGLAGSGSVYHSHAIGSVSGRMGVGGLTGWGSVYYSNFIGNVSGGDSTGGLAGSGSVYHSHATGSVSGGNAIGGLVGWGSVYHSYYIDDTGVQGTRDVGGLVGYNSGGTISNSYTSANVSGTENVGGLMGRNGGTVKTSYASGNVSGTENVGGLVGRNGGTLLNSFSTGNVTRTYGATDINFGGFVGYNNRGTIINSYSTGSVHYEGTDDPTDKGFAGAVRTGGNYEMTGNFWDVDTSGQSDTSGDAYGKTTGEMQNVDTFVVANWVIIDIPDKTERDMRYRWNIVNGETYPLLNMGELEPLAISNWHDLNRIRYELDGNYYLVNDLDQYTEGYMEYNDPEAMGWAPIGRNNLRFTGIFDGNNHTISGLYIEQPEATYVGLFSHASNSELRNIGILDANVTGNSEVGILVGLNWGVVNNSYATGNVSGDVRVGVLVGGNHGTISSSYATGNVSGRGHIGGLVGSNGGTLSKSYVTASVSGDWSVGGLVGSNHGTVSNSFYNVDSVLINDGHHITVGGIFNEQYTDWFNNGLNLNIEDYADTLSPVDGFYEIRDTDGLRDMLGFAERGGYKFRLAADIDLSDEPGLYIPYLVADFFGNNHVISNLHIDIPFAANAGMFACIYECRILDVGLVDAYVNGYWGVGGLVGENREGTISNSSVTGNVSGTSSSVGGLVGSNSWLGTVENSYAIGTVEGSSFVGGLMGYNDGMVLNSYATGEVNGNFGVGGLVGTIGRRGTVSNTYASGDVNGGDWYVGGLVGWNHRGSVSNSYATGVVSEGLYAGGLVGWNDGGAVENSFWDIEASGTGVSDGGVGKTTSEMMDITTYSDAGWDIATVDSTADRDIETIWNMVQAETYPFFSWKGLVLEVHITGNGKVDYDPPGHTYPHGTEVTLTATPDEGWYFSHWTGDVPEGEEENHEITMVMDGDKTLTAHFQRLYHTLTVNINGEGTTDPDVGTHTYLYGTEVTVIAVPAEGWYFNRWTGDVPSQQRFDPEITLVMDGDRSIRAHFGLLNFQLNISVEGNGSTYPEEGINWYQYGTEVTVMAVPDQGWSFSHWTGDVPEAGDKGNETSLFMDGHKNLTAHFVLDEYTLSIKREGDGTTIPSEGGHNHLYGDEVNVTAAPDEGWRFSHWSGDVPPGMEHTENISVLMDGNKSLTAHFESYVFAPDNLELMVTPLEGQPPLQITISVRGHNLGRREGSVDVLMDEEVIYSLLIPGNTSVEYTFHHIFTEPGVYVIEFQGISETIVVEESSPSESTFRPWMIPVAGIALISLALIYYLYKNPMKSKPSKVYGPDEVYIEVDETEDGFEELVDEI